MKTFQVTYIVKSRCSATVEQITVDAASEILAYRKLMKTKINVKLENVDIVETELSEALRYKKRLLKMLKSAS